MADLGYNFPFSLHSDSSGTGVDQPARDAANAAQTTATGAQVTANAAQAAANTAQSAAGTAQLTANQALVASQALTHIYASTTAAQADATLPNGSFYTVSNTTTKQLDLYSKTDSTASVFQFSLAQATQTNLNTTALAAINETVTPLVFATTPPASTDLYTEVFTTISNPSTRWTLSIVSGALQIAQIQAAVLCYGIQHRSVILAPSMVIEAEFVASAVSTNSGYGLSFNDTTTFDASHGRQLQIRQNGGVQPVWGSGAGSTTGISMTSVGLLPYAVGDVVILRLVVNSDPTTGTFYIIINGEVLGVSSVTGLPTGTQFIGALITQVGPITQATAQITRFQTHFLASDQTRWRSINVNGTGSDKGTEANPFLTINSAVRDFSDHPGRSAKLTLKGGLYRFPLVTALRSWREFTVRAEKGSDVIIHGSTLVTSGWTKTAGATNVYQRPTIADGLAIGSGTGGIVDLGTAMDLVAFDTARNASPTPRVGQTIPFTIYTRLSPANGTTILVATQIAACDAQPGSMFNDATSGGKTTYVHCLGNADPNTQQLEWCNRTSAVRVFWSAATDWNDCRVNLVGIHSRYAYNHVLWVQRAQVLIEECIAEGSSIGNGMNFDACGGSIYGGESRFSFNDGVHSDPVDLPTNIIKPQLRMFDVYTHHNLVGDGVSNHERTEHVGYSVRSNFNGKSGFAQIDTTRLIGCQMKGNNIAFNTGAQSVNQTIFMDLIDCDISDSPLGLNSVSGSAGVKVIMAVRGGRMANTAGHTEPAINAAALIGPGDLGGSTLSISGMRDDGNNGTIGADVVIEGRPGDLGIPRVARSSDLIVVGNVINTRGKAAGRGIRETDGLKRLLTADGPLPADPWRTADGVTTVVPL
jgi:hypothetical protein